MISDLNINLNVRKRFDIGIIPHETDKRIKNILSHFKNTNICLLDPNDHPLKFIENMLTCETIASSSLHGLIASDSLNIPNIWIKTYLIILLEMILNLMIIIQGWIKKFMHYQLRNTQV